MANFIKKIISRFKTEEPAVRPKKEIRILDEVMLIHTDQVIEENSYNQKEMEGK